MKPHQKKIKGLVQMGFPLQFGDFQFHVDFLGLFLPLQKKTL